MNAYTKRTNIKDVLSSLAVSVSEKMNEKATLDYSDDKIVTELAANPHVKFLSVAQVFETRNNYGKFIINDLSAARIAKDMSTHHTYDRVIILLPYNTINDTTDNPIAHKSTDHRMKKVNQCLSNFQLTADVVVSEDKSNTILSSFANRDDVSNALIIFPSYDGDTDPDVVCQLINSGCTCVEYRIDFDIRHKSNSMESIKTYAAAVEM